MSEVTYLSNAEEKFQEDTDNFGAFVGTKPSKSDKGSYFYNDQITWYINQGNKYASRKDEVSGQVTYYKMGV